MVTIRRDNFDQIIAQAEREYPFECCGFILGSATNTSEGATAPERAGESASCVPTLEEVRPISNVQNQKHAEDACAFPRDARTAYLMDPKEHLAVMREIDARHLELRAVYHSHPDHEAYFSPTDRAQACAFDPEAPDYPGTAYIVLSIREKRFARAAAFVWDEARKDFVETNLEVS